jgi:hypothetical protein
MAVRLSALRTGHALLAKNLLSYSFCQMPSILQDLVRPEGLGKWKENQ